MCPDTIAQHTGPELSRLMFELFAAGYIAAKLETIPHADKADLLARAGGAYRAAIGKLPEPITEG